MQPWREGKFKFSTDPELVVKVTDVIGLYLAPSENAVVLCVNEKSQIRVLDRTAPMLPMQPGKIARRTHDYTRHGTTTLFAALEIATGQVTAALKPKRRRSEFLAFLRQIERAYPGVRLHRVPDSYATHNPRGQEVARRPPAIHGPLHTDLGVLAQPVEVWFGFIDRQAIRRAI